ncbi:MAG: hypothetical protein HQM13_21930 [SAR324 cluster bacterium]|nr:hypothetical protein [SAR324 cluster bacterium]
MSVMFYNKTPVTGEADFSMGMLSWKRRKGCFQENLVSLDQEAGTVRTKIKFERSDESVAAISASSMNPSDWRD